MILAHFLIDQTARRHYNSQKTPGDIKNTVVLGRKMSILILLLATLVLFPLEQAKD
jgi:hypothetical protein